MHYEGFSVLSGWEGIMDNGEKSFEELLTQIESIVTEMESKKLPLDKQLASFEEGTALIRKCHSILKNAEGRVEQLSRQDVNASLTEAPASDYGPEN